MNHSGLPCAANARAFCNDGEPEIFSRRPDAGARSTEPDVGLKTDEGEGHA